MPFIFSIFPSKISGAERHRLHLPDPVLAVALAHPLRALLAAGGRVTESSTVAVPRWGKRLGRFLKLP